MLTKKGFTLIELLVVIAIITILAAIVAPRVQNWLERGRMARAVSEIRNADLALTKMLADADKKTFGQFFWWDAVNPTNMSMQQALKIYTTVFYELLRKGKNGDFTNLLQDGNANMKIRLKDVVYKKLGTTYMDIGLDPWGNSYQFYSGPLKIKGLSQVQAALAFYGFRSYRDDGYVYNQGNKDLEDLNVRGNPWPDNQPGYPCPWDLPAYIFSLGGDGEMNAVYMPRDGLDGNGGDDINNWDNSSGWGPMY